MRRDVTTGFVVCLALVWALAAARAQAQTTPFIDMSGELSPVTIGTHDTTWQTARLSGGVIEEGRFGVSAGVDRQRRSGLTDWAVHGTGYRQFGGWTVVGSAGYSHLPNFLYRRSLEAEVARRVVGGFVLHGAYRHLQFPAADVHLVQPAASLYFSRGHVQARGFYVRNTTLGRRSGTVLVRGTVDVALRLRLSAGTAIGTRIFDVAALPDARADAWVVFASAGVRLSPQWTMTVGAGGAHEDPLFSQRTYGLGLRWEGR